MKEALHVGDLVRVAGRRELARITAKIRARWGMPGVILLDRKVGEYWTYPAGKIVKVILRDKNHPAACLTRHTP